MQNIHNTVRMFAAPARDVKLVMNDNSATELTPYKICESLIYLKSTSIPQIKIIWMRIILIVIIVIKKKMLHLFIF